MNGFVFRQFILVQIGENVATSFDYPVKIMQIHKAIALINIYNKHELLTTLSIAEGFLTS